MTEIKNTDDLRQLLIECIRDVKSGNLEQRKAKAISDLSSNVLRSRRLDLEVVKFTQNGKFVLKAVNL
jgi:hypothetical protein